MVDIKGPWRRWVMHPLEAALVYPLYGLFRLLPLDTASAIGGWIGRNLGPYLPVTRRAVDNLRRAFPEKTAAEIARIVAAMWDNLGRVAAEYPQLDRIVIDGRARRVTIQGADIVDFLKHSSKPGILFSAHFGNWELASVAADRSGIALTRIYRAANNRLIEKLIRHGRRDIAGALVPKGAAGARETLAALKAGGYVAMLIDQKMNDGIAVPFFGRDAMTAPAIAQLALKFDCPVVPARVERLDGARFRVTVFPPLALPNTGDRRADVLAAMTKINAVLEGWIRERPEQWLWLHRRWPDS